MNTARVALALDELTQQMEQDEALRAAVATVWRAGVDVAFDDQLAAAARDATNICSALAQRTKHKRRKTALGDHPGWVRLNLFTALTSWIAGQADTCLHNPDSRSPQVMLNVAWKPNLVVCARCVHLLQLPKDSTPDRTCDGCGHITTGVENSDGIHQVTVIYGAFVHTFGVCNTCRNEWAASASDVSRRAMQ